MVPKFLWMRTHTTAPIQLVKSWVLMYWLFRRDRLGGQEGEVALYVGEQLECMELCLWWAGGSLCVRRQFAQTDTQEILLKPKKNTFFLLWGWVSTGTGSPERLWGLHSWGYQKVSGCDPEQPALGDSVLSRVNQTTFRGPSRLSDSLIQWFCSISISKVFLSHRDTTRDDEGCKVFKHYRNSMRSYLESLVFKI